MAQQFGTARCGRSVPKWRGDRRENRDGKKKISGGRGGGRAGGKVFLKATWGGKPMAGVLPTGRPVEGRRKAAFLFSLLKNGLRGREAKVGAKPPHPAHQVGPIGCRPMKTSRSKRFTRAP